MGFEQRDNSGAAWKNRRRTRDNQPNYTGSATINGEEYWVSVWVKEDRSRNANPGDKMISFAFEPKERREGARSAPADIDLSDDDIPF